MELTPEKFEKAEFTERRRGYDIDQVESFLEETGTEFAQMLAKFRHTEQRAAAAEARLAEGEARMAEVDGILADADQRVKRADEAARAARAEAESLRNNVASVSQRDDEEAEVGRVAKTLVIAQRTADATIADAESRAESLLDEARGRADRQMAEAIHEAEMVVNDARRRAEDEFADRHAAALAAVTELEGRRSQIQGVIAELENRLSGYREDLQRTAAELTSLAEDPNAIGPRESLSLLPDEVISSSEESFGTPAADATEDLSVEPTPEVQLGADTDVDVDGDGRSPGGGGGSSESMESLQDAGSAGTEVTEAESVADPQMATGRAQGYLDLTSATPVAADKPVAADEPVAAAESWGPGSWSAVEAELEQESDQQRQRVSASTISTSAMTSSTQVAGHFGGNSTQGEQVDDRPTQAVPRAEMHRDKYLEELDQAVNTPEDSDDEALAAFLDGGVDSKARRFGWRR